MLRVPSNVAFGETYPNGLVGLSSGGARSPMGKRKTGKTDKTSKSRLMKALFGAAMAGALVIVGVWAAKERWGVDIPNYLASALTTIVTGILTAIGVALEVLWAIIKQWHPRPIK